MGAEGITGSPLGLYFTLLIFGGDHWLCNVLAYQTCTSNLFSLLCVYASVCGRSYTAFKSGDKATKSACTHALSMENHLCAHASFEVSYSCREKLRHDIVKVCICNSLLFRQYLSSNFSVVAPDLHLQK